LPAQSFVSKKVAAEWALKNLDLTLDKKRSLTELNRLIVEEYGKKFGAKDNAEQVEDEETREENTKIEAIQVA
jgi:hypothetical protein